MKRTVILDNGRQLENEYSLRLYSLHELGQLLNASGFRVSEVSGRDALPGVFFGQESPNLMIVAERRPDSARRHIGRQLSRRRLRARARTGYDLSESTFHACIAPSCRLAVENT